MQQTATYAEKSWVRDHCHITGKYRGAAHNECNLKLCIYPNKSKVPVVIHNLRGYDGHLIMSELGKSETTKGQKITCIPNNMEKYMTFGFGQLQFIDSLQFMNSSLERLASNLQTEDLSIMSRGLADMEISLLRRKDVHPYEYVDGFERFGETQLPSKAAFYRHLSSRASATQTTITRRQYGRHSSAKHSATTTTFT